MGRFLKVVAAIGLLVVGSAVTASPAAAATPVTIMHAHSYACLYQSFDASGATVMAYYAASPCSVSSGSSSWRFEYLGGDNIYRIVNTRWDARGRWCLSAPNGTYSDVYVELCVPGVPGKQRWQPVNNAPEVNPWNRLRNIGANSCLHRQDVAGYRHLPVMVPCGSRYERTPSQDFKWL